jgi:hypothetical protein
LVAFGIVVGTGLQAAAAGVVHWWRGELDQELAAGQHEVERLRGDLARQVEASAASAPAPTAAPAGPRWQLLDGPDVAATLERLNRLGVDHKVAFETVKAVQSNTQGKQSFLLAGRGTPQQVCEFVAAIEQDDRLVIVETGRVMPGGGEQISFEFGVATYHKGGTR